jgi:hypothetical protein
MADDPQIIELDPEDAPRMTAIILLVCGLLGVGFLLVNVVFTGADQYYIQSEWDEGEEPVNQRYDILPNLVRGRQPVGESEEDAESEDVPVQKPVKKKAAPATTNPLDSILKRPGAGTPAGPGAPVVPGMPKSPGSSNNPSTPGAAPAK